MILSLSPSLAAEHKYCFGLNTEFGESVVRFFAENEEEKAEWLNELSAIKEKIDGDRAAREGDAWGGEQRDVAECVLCSFPPACAQLSSRA